MSTGGRRTQPQRVRRPAGRPYQGLLADQTAAILVAAILLVLGIAGFIPGLTRHVGDMHAIGSRSGAMLFGVFQVSLVLNLIHIAIGLAGLLLAGSFARARWYLLGGGLFCLGLWLVGILSSDAAKAVGLNSSDNWLHFGLGVTMIILGLTLAGTRVPTGAGGEVLLPLDQQDP